MKITIDFKIKVIIFVSAFILLQLPLFSQDTVKKPAKLIGEYTWMKWQEKAEWPDYTAKDFMPDFQFIPSLFGLIEENHVSFILFAGDWCGDSKTEVPKIYKILEIANVSLDLVKLYGVDRNKREGSGIAEKYKIEKVPTLIVLKNGTEAGRITEFPHKSWESDIFEIIKK